MKSLDKIILLLLLIIVCVLCYLYHNECISYKIGGGANPDDENYDKLRHATTYDALRSGSSVENEGGFFDVWIDPHKRYLDRYHLNFEGNDVLPIENGTNIGDSTKSKLCSTLIPTTTFKSNIYPLNPSNMNIIRDFVHKVQEIGSEIADPNYTGTSCTEGDKNYCVKIGKHEFQSCSNANNKPYVVGGKDYPLERMNKKEGPEVCIPTRPSSGNNPFVNRDTEASSDTNDAEYIKKAKKFLDIDEDNVEFNNQKKLADKIKPIMLQYKSDGKSHKVVLSDYLTSVKTDGLNDPYVPNIVMENSVLTLGNGATSSQFLKQNVYDEDNNAYDSGYNRWVYDNNRFTRENNTICERGITNLKYSNEVSNKIQDTSTDTLPETDTPDNPEITDTNST